jgi:nucleoside-diphosphate-sugar epimerase
MRVFLTGATGFIGGHLARQLRAAGHDVVALVRRPQSATALTSLGVIVAPGDLNDRASIQRGMQGADAVIHTAAWYKVGVRDKSAAVPTNVVGTRHVLEAMRDLRIPRGVYTSSLAINSDTQGVRVDETYRYTGPWLTHYEKTKWQAHFEVALPMIEQGLPLVIVMPGLVYGPGDQGVTHDFLVDLLRRRLPMAPQRTAFCWGHVEDTAAAHLLALQHGRPGETYHIAGPDHTMQEAIEVVTQLTGIPGPRWKPQPTTVRRLARLLGLINAVVPLPAMISAEVVNGIAGTSYIGDNAKARSELQFAPRTLLEGLRETLADEMRQLRMPLPPALQEPSSGHAPVHS